MAELADAPDLGSGGKPCRFKSCYPHFLYCKANCSGRHFVVHRMGELCEPEEKNDWNNRSNGF